MSETWGWPEVGQFAQAAGRSSLLVPKHTKVPGLVLHTQRFPDLLAWGAVALHVTRPARALLGESPAPRSQHHPTMSPNGFPYFSQIYLFLILYEGIFAPCTEGCQHQGGLLKLRGKENLHESK